METPKGVTKSCKVLEQTIMARTGLCKSKLCGTIDEKAKEMGGQRGKQSRNCKQENRATKGEIAWRPLLLATSHF